LLREAAYMPFPIYRPGSHKNIQHTVGYTEMAPDRFKDFWRS